MQILPHEHSFDEPLGLLSDCHRRIERFLEILIVVADEAPDDLPPKYRTALGTALDYFDQAAPKHTQDEEESLFPRIAGDPEAARTIAALEHDHARVQPLHDTVERLGRHWLSTPLSPADRREFQQTLTQLRDVYRDHIRVEDTHLFPLAARLLDPPTLQQIGEEMAARR